MSDAEFLYTMLIIVGSMPIVAAIVFFIERRDPPATRAWIAYVVALGGLFGGVVAFILRMLSR